MGQEQLDFLVFLDGNGDADGVDAALDEALFLKGAADGDRVEAHLGVVPEFDLGVALSLD